MKTNLSIFGVSKDELLEGLIAMHLQHCIYTLPGGLNSEKCDCKFGVFHPVLGPTRDFEQNGCPELRQVIDILSIMTEAEFLELAQRAKIVLPY